MIFYAIGIFLLLCGLQAIVPMIEILTDMLELLGAEEK